jgi:cytochrome c553
MLFPITADAVSTKTAPTIATVCAPCHGLDGVGRDVEIPNIAGQHSIYLREQLLAFKSGRRKHPEMYFVGRHLTDSEIDELVAYYSTLPPPR